MPSAKSEDPTPLEGGRGHVVLWQQLGLSLLRRLPPRPHPQLDSRAVVQTLPDKRAIPARE